MEDTLKWNILLSPGKSELKIKKSRFIGMIKGVRSQNEAQDFINSCCRKDYDAKHHCFAMRIGGPGKVYERFSDDGEPQGTAGKPMLDILKARGLYDLCAVVTRYFGGKLLGTGGLMRAYSVALCDSIDVASIAQIERGRRFDVIADYSVAQKIKLSSQRLGIALIKEEYALGCKLSFVASDIKFSSVSDMVRDISHGRAKLNLRDRVLYYRNPKTVIYKGNC